MQGMDKRNKMHMIPGPSLTSSITFLLLPAPSLVPSHPLLLDSRLAASIATSILPNPTLTPSITPLIVA